MAGKAKPLFARHKEATARLSVFLIVASFIPISAFAVDEDLQFHELPSDRQQTYLPDVSGVNNTGAFTQSYPIALPPGRNGIAPSLQLTYSNQDTRQDSIFGYGWSLNIPYIERINKIGVDKLYNQDLAHSFFYSSFSGELIVSSSTSPISSFLSTSVSTPLFSFSNAEASSSVDVIPEATSSASVIDPVNIGTTTATSTDATPPPKESAQAEAPIADLTRDSDPRIVPLADMLSPRESVEEAPKPVTAEDVVRPDGSVDAAWTRPMELVSDRAINAKKLFVGIDQSGAPQITYRFYDHPIHYADPDTGRMEEIDTRIEGGERAFLMTRAPYRAAFAKSLDRQLLTFAHDGQELYVDFPGITASSVENVRIETREDGWNGHTLVYSDAGGEGIDLVTRTADDRLIKEIVFREKPADLGNGDFYDLTFTLSANRPLTLSTNDASSTLDTPLVTSNAVTLTDDQGITTTILPPIASSQGENSSSSPAIIPIAIRYEKSGDTITFTKRIPRAFLESAVYPVVTDATFTLYPHESGNNTVMCASGCASTNWNTSHDATSGIINGLDGTASAGVYVSGGGAYTIYRVIVPVDTSSLPDDETVMGATLYLRPHSRDASDTGSTSYIAIVGPTTEASPTGLVGEDYDQVGAVDNPGLLSDTKRYQSNPWATSSFVGFSFNATGTANISKTGWTHLGIRSGHDIQDAAPTSTNVWNFYTSYYPGTVNDPYLEVTMAATSSRPSNLFVEGTSNPTVVATASPKFSAVVLSASSTILATQYQLQFTTSSTSWASLYWDSGRQTLSSSTPSGVRTPDIYATTTFPLDRTKYYWRMRLWDQAGGEGDWSTTGDYFTMVGTTSYAAKIETGDFLHYVRLDDHSWTATDKRGVQYVFGASTTSRVASSTNVYRWMLDSVTDPNGNSATYSYVTDAGQVYPWKIAYTAYNGTPGIYEIEFVRETRADIATSSAPGFAITTKQRIKEILIKTNGQITRRYQLGYQAGENDTRSLLSAVAESGWDAQSGTTTLPSTTFTYAKSSGTWTDAGWSLPSWYANTWDGYDNGMRLVDANGDGLSDILGWNGGGEFYRNTGANFSYEASSKYRPPVPFVWGATDQGTRFADITGDGVADLLRGEHFYNTQYLDTYVASTTAGWGATTTPNPPIFTDAGYGNYDVRPIDINGDGLADLVYPASGAVSLNTGDGTGWTGDSAWTLPETTGAAQPGHDLGFRFVDINGDHLLDVVISRDAYYAFNYHPRQTTYLNTGHGWAGGVGTTTFPFPVIATQGRDNGVRFADFNGDGLADATAGGTIYLNTGGSWVATTSTTFPTSIVCSNRDLGVFIDDLNGDGLPDVVKSNNYACATTEKKTYIKNGGKADVLTGITSDKGATTRVAYTTSAALASDGTQPNPNLPVNFDVAKTVATDPGFGGAVSTTTYDYRNGAYYVTQIQDRKFAGFASTTKTNSAGEFIRTLYHQGNASDSANGEYNDHIAKAGRPYRVEQYDRSGNLFTRTINTWARADYGDGRNFVKLWQSLAQTFDGDSTHRDTAEIRLYDDANGNLTTSNFFGEVQGSSDGTFADTPSTDGATTTYSYAASSTNTTMSLPSRELVVDQSGTTVRDTKWTYDGLSFGSVSKGNQTKEERLKSGSSYASTTRTFNSYGLVTQSTDPRGGTTTYAYDAYNLYPATTTNALGQTQVYAYDYSSGKVATTTDANSRTFASDYDGLDRPIREKQPDFTTPSTLALKADYSYTDSTSTPSSVFSRTYLNSGTSSDLYAYLDGLGRTIQTRKESETSYSTADTIYNSIGQVGTTSLPYFSSGSARTTATTTNYLLTAMTYDAAGRVKTVADVFGTTTNTYSDWFTRVTDPLGNTKDALKDAYGNLAAIGEKLTASTATTTYAWNLNKKLTKITDASTNIRNFTYDNLGRLTLSEDLHASADTTFGTTTRAYDDAGNVTQVINPRGQTITYAYDALNRATSEDFTGQSGTEASYFYDTCTNGKGRLCSVRKQGEATTTYLYNPIGLVSAEGKVIGLGTTAVTATTSFTHLRNGREDTITYPDAALVSYLYDAAGLLDKVLNKESGGSTANVITRVTWTPAEQIEALDTANGVTSTSTYDKAQKYRLTQKLSKNTTALQDIRYTYDAAGNITTFDDQASTTARKTVTYTYDPLYRLLSASTTAVATGTSGYLQSFMYDALGNLLTGPGGAYTYGQTGYANPDAVTALAGTAYAYDLSGNLASRGNSTFTWDYNNRMASATVVTASTTGSGGGGGTSTATPAFVQSALNSTDSEVVLPSSVTSGNLIVVGLTTWSEDPIPSDVITDNKGNTYTMITEVNNDVDHGAIFYAKNVTGGSSFTVTSSYGGTISAHEYSGISTSSPLDKWSSATGTSNAPNSGSTTTTQGNELYFGLAWSMQDGDSWTAGSGYALREQETNNATSERHATEDRVLSSASTTFANFSVPTSELWLTLMATFKPLVTTTGSTGGGTSTATPAFVQSELEAVNGSATFPSPVTTGNLVIVGVTAWSDSSPISTSAITDNKGNTYTHVTGISNDVDHGAIFYAKNVTGGSSFTVTNSFGGTMSIHEYSGVSTSSPLDKWSSAIGTSNAPNSGSTTTTQGNELYFGLAWSMQHNDTWTAGSGYTLRTQETNNTTLERHATEDRVLSSASTTFANFSVPTTEGWISLMATFKPLVTTSSSSGTTTSATTTVTYKYDHNGDRVQMTDSTTTSYFGKWYQQTTNGYTKTKQIYANGQLVATIEKKGSATAIPYYVSSDNLGGASILTNASGTATQTLDYFPFGDIRVNSKNTSFDSVRKYIGQINDTATNLDYLNARYYDAARGQFTGQDPIARDLPLLQERPAYILDANSLAGKIDQTALLSNPQALNFYSYSTNRPITMSDPSGESVYETSLGFSFGPIGLNVGFRVEPGVGWQVFSSNSVGFGGVFSIKYDPEATLDQARKPGDVYVERDLTIVPLIGGYKSTQADEQPFDPLSLESNPTVSTGWAIGVDVSYSHSFVRDGPIKYFENSDSKEPQAQTNQDAARNSSNSNN